MEWANNYTTNDLFSIDGEGKTVYFLLNQNFISINIK